MIKRYWWLIISVLAVTFAFFNTFEKKHYDSKYYANEKLLIKLNGDIDSLKRKNAKVIYYPKQGNANLSSDQMQSVKWLINFFTATTTFRTSDEYLTNYNIAREHINDEDFYQKFMSAPTTGGVDNVSVSKIMMQNIATQVIVVGPNQYEVYLSYVAYHSPSDLYQKNNLDVVMRVFSVQGYGTHFDKVTLLDNLVTPYKTVGDLGKLM